MALFKDVVEAFVASRELIKRASPGSLCRADVLGEQEVAAITTDDGRRVRFAPANAAAKTSISKRGRSPEPHQEMAAPLPSGYRAPLSSS